MTRPGLNFMQPCGKLLGYRLQSLGAGSVRGRGPPAADVQIRPKFNVRRAFTDCFKLSAQSHQRPTDQDPVTRRPGLPAGPGLGRGTVTVAASRNLNLKHPVTVP